MGKFEEDEVMQDTEPPQPICKDEEVDPKVKRKSLLMQSLAAKYLTSDTPTAEGDETKPSTEDEPVKLRDKKGRRDVRSSALFKSLTSKYLSCEIEDLPVQEEYVRKPKELDKSEAELPMGKSKFERIQGLLNQNLPDLLNKKPKQVTRSSVTSISEDGTDSCKPEMSPITPITLGPPPPPPPAPPIPKSLLRRSLSTPSMSESMAETEETRQLLGASAKSRLDVNKHRKRRPPSRRPVYSMYDKHISIDEEGPPVAYEEKVDEVALASELESIKDHESTTSTDKGNVLYLQQKRLMSKDVIF